MIFSLPENLARPCEWIPTAYRAPGSVAVLIHTMKRVQRRFCLKALFPIYSFPRGLSKVARGVWQSPRGQLTRRLQRHRATEKKTTAHGRPLTRRTHNKRVGAEARGIRWGGPEPRRCPKCVAGVSESTAPNSGPPINSGGACRHPKRARRSVPSNVTKNFSRPAT